MRKFKLDKRYILILLIYTIVNLFCLLCKNGYIQLSFYMDINVVVIANTLLFILSLVASYRHKKASLNKNPNVFIRSVMLMTIVKLFVLCGAAFLYVYLARQNRNMAAIIASLILYIVYAVFEVRGTYNMNKKKN